MYISIDYDVALKQAQKLERIADEYNEVLQTVNKQLSIIEDTWEGCAAEAYKAKLQEYKQQNKKIQNELRQTAGAIRQVVKVIREADEEAAANSNSRKSTGSGGGRKF